MPSHSSSSVAPWVPHTQAVAHDVVGRRTPTAESSSPVSALNVEDLPEPVAPAIATTVCSAASRSRLEARSTTSCAGVDEVVVEPTAGMGDRGLEAGDACAHVRAPGDQVSAPSSKDVIVSLGAGVRVGQPTLFGVVAVLDPALAGEPLVVDAAGRVAQPVGSPPASTPSPSTSAR